MGRTTKALGALIAGLRSGQLKVATKVADELWEELKHVKHDENGEPILATCSPKLRSMARATHLAMEALESEQRPGSAAAEATRTPLIDPREVTRELFRRLDSFFLAATGTRHRDFAADGDFGAGIRRLGEQMRRDPLFAQETFDGANAALLNLQAHYATSTPGLLPAIRQLGGTKLVLGGKQSFSESSLSAVRSMLLYADTILIPDPVFRWLEAREPREQERAWRIQMLEDIWWLLKLSPLVDADLAVPPVLVFPSFEKSLEEGDEQTQFGMEFECVRVFSHHLGQPFDEMADVAHFAATHPKDFLAGVRRSDLFVPMGGTVGMRLRRAIAVQRAELARQRSDKVLALVQRASDAHVVLVSIRERLGPLYHLGENAAALAAAPLLTHDVHWHYAQKRSAAMGAVRAQGADQVPLNLIRALEDGPHTWLGNVPIAQLVELRREGANRAFRERMGAMMQRLSATGAPELDQIAGEIAHEFRQIVQEHEAEVRRVDQRLRGPLAAIGVATVLSAAASFTPWFPTSGALGLLAATTAYAAETVKAHFEKERLRGTLIGVLAASARRGPSQGM